MNFVFLVHTTQAYKKYLLPSVNNTDYTIVLKKEIFNFSSDLEIKLENIEGSWSFTQTDAYILYDSITKENYFGKAIQNQDLLSISAAGYETINILIQQKASSFHVFSKYDIRYTDNITIGKNESNDIQYNIMNLISREHAVIRRNGNDFILQDTSANGVYINDVRIRGTHKLEFGDYIDIFGLCIVYLDGILAINTENDAVRINSNKLREYEEIPDNTPVVLSLTSDKKLYHRSPRQVYKMDDEEIQIEAPPHPKTQNKRP